MPMDDYDQSQYQEVSKVSKRYSGRHFKAVITGLCFGLLLLVGGYFTMADMEIPGLQTARSLSEARKILIAVPISPVYQKNNLHVVYLSGVAATDETLTDPLLVVSGQVLRLNRKVENYQWLEAQKASSVVEKHRDAAETKSIIYVYSQGWREGLADSHAFKHPEGHENPTAALFTSDTFAAKKITLGDFTLPTPLYKDITASTPMDLTTVDLSNIQKTTQKSLFRSDNEIFIGADPQHPQVGDARITLTAVLPQVVSVIGQQAGEGIQAFVAPAGAPVLLLVLGHQPPQTMLKSAASDYNVETWLLGFILLLVILGGYFLFKMTKTKRTVAAPDVADTAEPTFPIEDDEKYHNPPE
jgi:hypothetical protein